MVIIERFLADHRSDTLVAGSGLLANKLEAAHDFVAAMATYGYSVSWLGNLL